MTVQAKLFVVLCDVEFSIPYLSIRCFHRDFTVTQKATFFPDVPLIVNLVMCIESLVGGAVMALVTLIGTVTVGATTEKIRVEWLLCSQALVALQQRIMTSRAGHFPFTRFQSSKASGHSIPGYIRGLHIEWVDRDMSIQLVMLIMTAFAQFAFIPATQCSFSLHRFLLCVTGHALLILPMGVFLPRISGCRYAHLPNHQSCSQVAEKSAKDSATVIHSQGILSLATPPKLPTQRAPSGVSAMEKT